MRRLTRYLLAGVASAALAPAPALAAEIVPPGNSGVNQYTQTVPTAGGNVAVEHQEIRQPKQVLGKGHAKKLEEKGPEGKAAAELAATSSPPAEAGGAEAAPAPAGGGAEAGGGGHERQQGGVAGGGSGSSGGSGGAPGTGSHSSGKTAQAAGHEEHGGSSGLGQIVRQATGSTASGELGPLMPIVLLAGLAWCIAFTWRQRRHPA